MKPNGEEQMAAKSAKWRQYTLTHRHERRAVIVCQECHARKTKCDLHEQQQLGKRDCSFCSRSGRVCSIRMHRRRPRRVTTTANSRDTVPTTTRDNSDDHGVDNNNGATSNAIQLSVKSTASNGLDFLPTMPRSHDEVARSPDTARQPTDFSTFHKGDVDTGFTSVIGVEIVQDAARSQALKATPRHGSVNNELQMSEELLNIFADTYFDDCYAFCPVLDRNTLDQDLAQSPMLQNALATLGINVRPPILPHEGPAVHYDRARRMFYDDEEPDNLTCLRGILLWYWYAPRSTSTVHRHSSWWWTSVVIRHAQQMAMHRAAASLNSSPETSGLGRRVWWTAFARERLTALCQSKPPIIDPDDCNVPEPSLEDFPLEARNDPKALVFIYWVRLSAIIGRIAQFLSRNTPSDVAEHCRGWIVSLPPQIRISLTTRNFSSFDKDAYQLHIPYLITIMILNLRRVREPGALPIALPPAIVAASCLARIYKAMLAKGDTRFLMPITSWYCAVPYMTLVSASRDPALREAALSDMEIVALMCDQLRKMWASADVIYNSFARLRTMAEDDRQRGSDWISDRTSVASQGNDEANGSCPNEAIPGPNSFNWVEYFPFASNKTSRLVEILLQRHQSDAHVTNLMTWDPSLLEVRDWSDVMLEFNDFTFENEFLNSCIV
jgi:hypothetical protein